MNRMPASDTQIDALLRRELQAPLPSPELRRRVFAATAAIDPAALLAERQRALQDLRARSLQLLGFERRSLLRDVLVYLSVGGACYAVLPSLVERLGPVFSAASAAGVDGLSMTIGAAAICVGLGMGFPRQLRSVLGV